MEHQREVDFSGMDSLWEWRKKWTHEAVTEDFLKSLVGKVVDLEQYNDEGKPFGAVVGVVGYDVDYIFNSNGEFMNRYYLSGDEGMGFLIYRGAKITVMGEGNQGG